MPTKLKPNQISIAFTDLTDAPAVYTGNSGKLVKVKATENGLEFVAPTAGSGDVVGPASAVDGNLALFDGVSGKLIKDGGAPSSGGGGFASPITVMARSYDTEVGTWGMYSYGSQFASFVMAQALPVDGEYLTYIISLDAGTYTFALCHMLGNNGGLLDVYIDATKIGTVDQYAAATTYNVLTKITGVVIATAGIKTLKLIIAGKHASSTGYKAYISYFTMWRTT